MVQGALLLFLLCVLAFASYDRATEVQWMRRIQEGDTEALRNLYRTYKDLLFGLILKILKDREEAEDCLQEVFTQAWERADRFDAERGTPYGFLVTMARNKAIDRTRSKVFKNKQRQDQVIDDFTLVPTSKGHNPAEHAEQSDRADQLRAALQEIPENQRYVLRLAYFGGMTQSEIAKETGIPLGTVKYRTRQGMMKLRELLSFIQSS
ncbi:MAG: sigma-70 family RNA polymerase sigma factor [Bacteroidetes bacterium]|jgi:RNA polymerase sigma-70 factor (ECF subfamily)|nr:sigma-70 family RNA polymerase sigma factor [Bacteroidota bacterium]